MTTGGGMDDDDDDDDEDSHRSNRQHYNICNALATTKTNAKNCNKAPEQVQE